MPRIEDELQPYIADLVKNAMLTAWNNICADTNCHPLDLERGRGGHLTFTPRHWAQAAGEMVEAQIERFLREGPATGGEMGGTIESRLGEQPSEQTRKHDLTVKKTEAKRAAAGFPSVYFNGECSCGASAGASSEDAIASWHSKHVEDNRVADILDAFRPLASLADYFDDYEPSDGAASVLVNAKLVDLRRARDVYRSRSNKT